MDYFVIITAAIITTTTLTIIVIVIVVVDVCVGLHRLLFTAIVKPVSKWLVFILLGANIA